MYILIPGRHHLLTNFQFQYLYRISKLGFNGLYDSQNNVLPSNAVKGIIFAVTSCNHQGTRRNPLDFAKRAMAIQDFSHDLSVPVYCFGIEDVGFRNDFASYTIKSVQHQIGDRIQLSPKNTIIACATEVGSLYENIGYQVFPAEKSHSGQPLPWEIIKEIADTHNLHSKPQLLEIIHPASYRLYERYNLHQLIHFIFNDPIIGEDGDLTDTRDYSSYIRQMDEIADIKWQDTAPFVQAGRIGDIGCSAGSWLKLASSDGALQESDFYGIEVARQLYQLCLQRKENNEFSNPNIWFSQKNAVTGLVFQSDSMNTIHSSSLTHEIESYGSHKDLLQFISNRFNELLPGGVWINRDVVGPEDREKQILLWANPDDDAWNGKSTRDVFRQFAQDFRKHEGYTLSYKEVTLNSKTFFRLSMEDASEFLLTKDYTDNWESEMHERFCFWSLSEWKTALEEYGFEIQNGSRAFTNQWIAENRFNNKVELFDLNGKPLPYPPTNMIIIAKKPG